MFVDHFAQLKEYKYWLLIWSGLCICCFSIFVYKCNVNLSLNMVFKVYLLVFIVGSIYEWCHSPYLQQLSLLECYSLVQWWLMLWQLTHKMICYFFHSPDCQLIQWVVGCSCSAYITCNTWFVICWSKKTTFRIANNTYNFKSLPKQMITLN